MTALDYAATYAVYVLSSGGALLLLMYGWSLVLRGRAAVITANNARYR